MKDLTGVREHSEGTLTHFPLQIIIWGVINPESWLIYPLEQAVTLLSRHPWNCLIKCPNTPQKHLYLCCAQRSQSQKVWPFTSRGLKHSSRTVFSLLQFRWVCKYSHNGFGINSHNRSERLLPRPSCDLCHEGHDHWHEQRRTPLT